MSAVTKTHESASVPSSLVKEGTAAIAVTFVRITRYVSQRLSVHRLDSVPVSRCSNDVQEQSTEGTILKVWHGMISGLG